MRRSVGWMPTQSNDLTFNETVSLLLPLSWRWEGKKQNQTFLLDLIQVFLSSCVDEVFSTLEINSIYF